MAAKYRLMVWRTRWVFNEESGWWHWGSEPVSWALLLKLVRAQIEAGVPRRHMQVRRVL